MSIRRLNLITPERLVAEFADEILVMYAGQVCEVGPIGSVIDEAKHPYTRALAAVGAPSRDKERYRVCKPSRASFQIRQHCLQVVPLRTVVFQ